MCQIESGATYFLVSTGSVVSAEFAARSVFHRTSFSDAAQGESAEMTVRDKALLSRMSGSNLLRWDSSCGQGEGYILVSSGWKSFNPRLPRETSVLQKEESGLNPFLFPPSDETYD